MLTTQRVKMGPMAQKAQKKPQSGGRRFRGQSPEERREHRREQLLDAGRRTFGAHGFHAVGVRDICAAAGLTERYFYESFANREALFVAVYEHAVERVRSAVSAAIEASPPNPTAMARTALRAYLETLREEPHLARVLLVEVYAIGAEAGERSQKVMASFAEQIAALVQGFFPDFPESGLDPQLVANGLFGSTMYQVIRWADGGYAEPIERILEHCVFFYEAAAAEGARRGTSAATSSKKGTGRGGTAGRRRRQNGKGANR